MISSRKENILRILRAPLEVMFLRYLFILIILIPTIMFLVWWFSPKQKMNIILVNKSVPEMERIEHSALSWMLLHDRIVKPDDSFYDKKSDYYGFFPREGGDYVIRDFSEYDNQGLDSLVQESDLIYFADAYGVYMHSYGGDLQKPNRLIYGGVAERDLALLKSARTHGVMTITEFSLFEPPTTYSLRDSLELLFGLRSSGWVGRYFISLDTTANDALPSWVVGLYQQQHPDQWPYRDSGIVLVRGAQIVILEYGKHLTQETPLIETQEEYAASYHVAPTVRYPFWFDIVTSPDKENRIISIFHLPVNAAGDSILIRNKIPNMFPAVLYHADPNEPFYYFAGDFSDNPVVPISAYFKGISFFQSFFYNRDQMDDRRQFFWRYYRPLLHKILGDLNSGP